jgi:hypothetical protein
MGYLGTGRTVASNNLDNGATGILTSDIGLVYDIILDENHEYLKKYKEQDRIAYIGAILFRYILDSKTPPPTELFLAQPKDKIQKSLPVVNEKVQIVDSGFGPLYIRNQSSVNINNSAIINTISTLYGKPEDLGQSPNVNSYNRTSETQSPGTKNKNEAEKYNKFGNYFVPNNNIHKLKLYEGDTILESRFGQSIRFSGYNNKVTPNPIESPTLIIRNGESPVNLLKPTINTVEEDLNRDGSIIALTSNEYQMDFQPGFIDANSKSNFETKPESFVDYPQQLKGNQMLLNSGRIILSAKSGEMIFYSKKNYGFISDGGLSIDNKLGIDVNVKDNINILSIVTGNGKIFLGSKELEPMVKGQKLVEILGELLDAIGELQFKTPAGPSAIGSENRKIFENIKSKLNNILSGFNQTA